MKNKTLRLGLVALLLVAVTMSIISGTLAKYVDSFNGSDSARVAKFEYTVEGLDKTNNTIDIFKTADDTGILGDKDGNNTTDKLIAPGTNGSFEVTLTNKSEVLIKADYTFKETNDAKVPVVYEYDSKYYSSVLPVDAEVTLHDGDADKAKVFGDLTALATAIGDATEVGYDKTKVITVNWAWAFEGEETVDPADATQSDDTDTSFDVKGSDTVTLKVECDIEQVDAATVANP